MALCLVLLCAGGAYLVNNPRFMQRTGTIVSKVDPSNNARFVFWNECYRIFKEHPILGVGLGQAKAEYKKTGKLTWVFTHAHSNFFQMLSENGLVGFLGYLGFVGYYVIHGFKSFNSKKSPLSLIFATTTFALFLQGVTEYNFGNSAVMKAFWMVCASILTIYKYIEDKAK